MDKRILETFKQHLAEHPLPSRRRAGAAEKTIRGYAQDISIFLDWWRGTVGSDLTLDLLQADPYLLHRKVLSDFLGWLQTIRHYRAATVLRYAASLRAFCWFLVQGGLIPHDPCIGLRLPERETPAPRGLSDVQRHRFEAVFLSEWTGKTCKRPRAKAVAERVQALACVRLARDKAIAWLMLYAGLRVEEVERLDVGDVTLHKQSGLVLVRRGKGFRERSVPLPKPARLALADWLAVRGRLAPETSRLFVSLRRRPYEPLSKRSMQAMIAEAGQRAGLESLDPPVRLTAHTLRHTAAFMLRQAGVGLEVRAKYLGHSMQTAMRYGAPRAAELEAAARALDEVGTC